MGKLANIVKRKAAAVVRYFMGNELAQEENSARGEKKITPGIPEILRECAAEGIVLLKNENNTLPLTPEQRVSVFGRCQNDWFYVGYGSGGDVHPPYTVNLMDGLRNVGVRLNEEVAERYRVWGEKPENTNVYPTLQLTWICLSTLRMV